MKKVRCAIYTRKSSEEGLEQAFNSLDAQREACAAYILSQTSEGWTELPQLYDDGGLSGGSLARPALQQLLADIAEGRIDIVVVYKVDRLTRSLLDFSKLVEAFDKAGVSFVSVTQSFNTTTSMGRLTLNMLLSFAQFEREVTAERIRDKIAASKAKGMWMGGVPPLGYEADGRSLKIVPEHAAIVRHIYASYLALGNVRLVEQQLTAAGAVSPVRHTNSQRVLGGKPFSRGQLYFMLKSPIYVGDIPHQEKSYPGLHEAIIERDTWTRVQSQLADQTQGRRHGVGGAGQNPLTGKLVDAAGRKLTVSHTCKGARRYRYYVGQRTAAGAHLRIPAPELDRAVAECIAQALDDPFELMAKAGLSAGPVGLSRLAGLADELATKLRQRDYAALRSLVTQVRFPEDRLCIECDASTLANQLKVERCEDAPSTVQLTSNAWLKRSGHVVRFVQPGGAVLATAPTPSLLKLLLKARRWWGDLRTGEVDITELARRDGVSRSYITRVVRLAFLAPAVVDAILAGHTLAAVDGMMLTSTDGVHPLWSKQVQRLLPA
jgi:DNA invertase Pin-like site-specific DNA recombinase